MIIKKKNYQFETQCIQGGIEEHPANAHAVPIFMTNAYLFNSAEHAAQLFNLEGKGYIYSRFHNPTIAVLEERINLLEGGVGALAVASGTAAISLTILNLASSGDEIVAASTLYGGTYNLLANTLPHYGIKTRFVEPSSLNNFQEVITERTKAILIESIGNPSLNIIDIEQLAELAHQNGIPLIVDNTFATPYLFRPIEHGADIVVHSATKWIAGNGTTMGGLIIDGGKFNWDNKRFPEFTEPDVGYHNLIYSKEFKEKAFITKARVQQLRDFGQTLSPFNAFLLLLGIETLPVRMKEHVNNAREIANFLTNHPKVNWVWYPELATHPSYNNAKRYFPKGAGSVVVFGVKGGREAGAKLINNLELWSHVANVGDAKSLVIHPASTTHQQLSKEELEKAGVPEDLLRLSVGIEHSADLINDLEQALSKI